MEIFLIINIFGGPQNRLENIFGVRATEQVPVSSADVSYRHQCVGISTVLLCKAKRQYLLTCKVSRYCLLSLHGRVHAVPANVNHVP